MSSFAILIDFGSTYTKVVAVDLASANVIGRSQSASTVQTDVREGLLDALTQLHERHGLFKTAQSILARSTMFSRLLQAARPADCVWR